MLLQFVITNKYPLGAISATGAMFSAMFESIPFCMLVLIPFDIVLLVSGGLFINLK